MKSIGSLVFLFGAAAIIFSFFDRVPRLLVWIDNWGETTSWAIKIALVVIGAVLFVIGSRQKQANATADTSHR